MDKVFSRHPDVSPEELLSNRNSRALSHNGDVSVGGDQSHISLLRQESLLARHEEMSIQKLCILTALILTSTFIIALCVDDLGLILGFVGSVGSTSISFIVSYKVENEHISLVTDSLYISYPAFFSAHYTKKATEVDFDAEHKHWLLMASS